MKRIVLTVLLASFGLTSAATAEGNQTMNKYSYKYQKQQEEEAKNQYKKQNQYRYKTGNTFQGTNPNMGSMGGSGMRMGGGGGRH